MAREYEKPKELSNLYLYLFLFEYENFGEDGGTATRALALRAKGEEGGLFFDVSCNKIFFLYLRNNDVVRYFYKKT